MHYSFTMPLATFFIVVLIAITTVSARGEEIFDDERCWQVQSEQRKLGGCGIRIPPLATMIEVNGLVLPIESIEPLQKGTFPYLVLPKGKHSIRFRPGETAVSVTIRGHFRTFYDQLRRAYGLPKMVDEDRLIAACADALDAYSQPFLLNIHGSLYAKRKMREEAVRKWKRAVRINPTFAPAHLNLAASALAGGDKPTGLRELRLAEAFNIGDVYGINSEVEKLRIQFYLETNESTAATIEWTDYLPPRQLTEKDRRMAAMMGGLSKYATDAGERAKILNNLAVYFSTSEKPEWACEYFRQSLNELRADKDNYGRLATEIMRHMRDTCQAADMENERSEYSKVVQRLNR